MNNKVLLAIIAFLLGIIAYQSGILDSFFQKGVKCNSDDAKRVGKQIISEKLLPRYLSLFDKVFDYKLEDISFANIITKKYDKETGFHKCYADAYLTIKTFPKVKDVKKFNDKANVFFKLIFATDTVDKLAPNTYRIKVPVTYTTEITDDKKGRFFEYMKFDISKEKIYQNLFLLDKELNYK